MLKASHCYNEKRDHQYLKTQINTLSPLKKKLEENFFFYDCVLLIQSNKNADVSRHRIGFTWNKFLNKYLKTV